MVTASDLWSRRWSRYHGAHDDVEIMSAAPVCRTKAPHWMSPWAYNASLTPLQTKEAFHTPREHMDDQASPHTGLLSVWVWYLLGPTAAWALQASREVGPTLGRCDKPHMVDAVMEDGKLVDVVIKESTQDPDERARLRHKARAMATEMAAHLQLWMHRVWGYLLTKVFHVLLAGEVYASPHKLDKLRDMERSHTLVYVPTHKSYFDFMVLPYALFAWGLKVPHTVSGQNLRIPGVQFIMSRNGAFYIRRTMKGFTDGAVYKAVLQQYVREILLRCLSFCVYAEGGRSRDGRVQAIKMGLLAYLIDATLDAGLPQPLAFVPCAISYDRAPEEVTMMKELTGKPKRKETFWALLWSTLMLLVAALLPSGIRPTVGGRCGRGYVSMADPIVLDSVVADACDAAVAKGDLPSLDFDVRAVPDAVRALRGQPSSMTRDAAMSLASSLLPHGSTARKNLVSAMARAIQPRLVKAHVVPNSAVVSGAMLAAACGLLGARAGSAGRAEGNGSNASAPGGGEGIGAGRGGGDEGSACAAGEGAGALVAGVGVAEIGRACRALEGELRARGVLFTSLPETCGKSGTQDPTTILEHAKVVPSMLEAVPPPSAPPSPPKNSDGSSGSAPAQPAASPAPVGWLRVRGTAESWLHLQYRLNQLLPAFAKEGLVAAAAARAAAGAKDGAVAVGEVAAGAVELLALLRRELDGSALAPEEMGTEAEAREVVEGMVASGALERVGGGRVRLAASGAARDAALLGAALLAPAINTYLAALDAGVCELRRQGRLSERRLLQHMQGTVIARSCVTEAPPEDVATLPGPFLVPSVVVVSNALDAFKHLGIFTAEDPSDSEASDSPAATPLSGQDGGAKVDGGERGRDSEVVQMPRVESSVNLTWSVFGHHGRGGGLRRGRGAEGDGARRGSAMEAVPEGEDGSAEGAEEKERGPKADGGASGAAGKFASTGGLRVGGSEEAVVLGTQFQAPDEAQRVFDATAAFVSAAMGARG